MISRRKARILAVQALYEWDLTRKDLDSLLEFRWYERKEGLVDEDLLFSRLLVQGTIKNMERIDALLTRHSKNWELSRFSRVDLSILRMSAYSLIYHEEIPASVTIDEAVEIAREFGNDESYRFINGVL